MVAKSARLAYIFLLLGLVLRIAYVRYLSPVGHSIYSDMANYVAIADMIQAGDWRITHFFQPIGFPYVILFLKMLSPEWTQLFGEIQMVVGTITVWLVSKSASKSFGEKTGLLTLLLGAIHLPWISFTGLALAETIFIFWLAILCWLSLKVVEKPSILRSLSWTLVFFLAFLMKGTHIFYGPLFLLGLIYFKKKAAIPVVITISVIMSILLLGHGLFSKAKVDKFLLSANAGGLNFVEGKCPQKNNADNAGYSWLSPLYFQLGMTEQKKWDRPFSDSGYFMKEGFKCIQKNPYVLIQSLEGIPFLFMGNTLWPANQSKISQQMRLYELLFACFSVVGLVVFFRFYSLSGNKEEEMLVWILPVISVFLCVYIFKSELRFRIPFDVWIIPVAIKGWQQLINSRPVT